MSAWCIDGRGNAPQEHFMDGNKPWVSWSLTTKIVVSIAGVLATVLVLVLNFA